MRRVLALVTVLAALAALAAAPALAATPQTTLNDVEDEVMCVVCGVPLNIAESPQADRERAFINRQIAQGKTKDEIKDAMRAEYGDAVIATPEGGGFEVTNWLIPALVALVLVAAVAVLVPRWRRRQRTAGADATAADVPALSPDEARRLDEDLARYR
ncbi:MAG: cytochrome c-type biogenesis protein CcmH [Solirubrobacteraceae bacterium]